MKKLPLLHIRWEIPAALSLFIGLMLAFSQVRSGTALTIDQTRPLAVIALVGLAGLTLWQLQQAWHAYQRYSRQRTLMVSLRMVSWLISLGLVCALPVPFMVKGSASLWTDQARILEIFIPLAMGIQAALMFAPEDDEALEVTLSYPRPLAWLVLERLIIGFTLQLAAGVIGLILTFAMVKNVDILTTVLRWLPPLVFFGGLGLYITLRSRVTVFGVVMTVLLWGSFLIFGQHFLPGAPTISFLRYVQPFFWAIHPYLEPGDLAAADYWLNRGLVSLLGMQLIALAIAQLKDEEILLLERKS